MNASTQASLLLKAGIGGGGRDPAGFEWRGGRRKRALGTGLWAFIAVATTLFSLFLATYVMRMEGSDWSPVQMPPQLWVSTALLAAGSVFLHHASRHAMQADWARARRLLVGGGALALAFLAVQCWAWAELLAQRVGFAGNPAASFFYLLTALHGMHVLGGLIAWMLALHAARFVQVRVDPEQAAGMIALLARYWHFLLAVWIVLFATLGWLTPQVWRAICGIA